jgi:hypothetical protein
MKYLVILFLCIYTQCLIGQDRILINDSSYNGKITRISNEYVYFKETNQQSLRKIPLVQVGKYSIDNPETVVYENESTENPIPSIGIRRVGETTNLTKKIEVGIQDHKSQMKSEKTTSEIENLNYKIDYIQYCMGKFHNQHGIGTALTITGVAISTIALITIPQPISTTTTKRVNGKNTDVTKVTQPNYDVNKVFIGIGALMSIVGSIVVLDSYKWIKRGSISPTRYGVSFEMLF